MTGVEGFDNTFVTVCRSSENWRGFLFKWLTTKAVHREIVTSLDSNSCVMWTLRVASRRGTQSVVWSNNYTKFVDFETKFVESLWKRMDRNPNYWSTKPFVDVHAFQNTSARWVVERTIRSCERSSIWSLGDRRHTNEIIMTFFCLVEQALKMRPLTPVGLDTSINA